MNSEILGKKVCIKGSGGPLVFTGLHSDDTELLYAEIKKNVKDRPFTLVSFEVKDWNLELSPWRAEGIDETQVFGGGGEETLEWLRAASESRTFSSFRTKYIAGYSLAGLFSLWSLYENDLFDGCACCSGTMWLPGWTEYASSRSLSKAGIVYLSLGGKEEKSRNPLMSTIGEKTKAQDRLLEKDKNVLKHRFEMNPGGHFSDPSGRLAKGIAWLIENEPELD